jgi:hypothetical protein
MTLARTINNATPSISKFSIPAISIRLNVTYAECRVFEFVMVNGIMLNAKCRYAESYYTECHSTL